MLSINIKKAAVEHKKRTNRSLTSNYIHLKTGIHKKILSRMRNKPQHNLGSKHIDKLVEFFFLEWRSSNNTVDEDRKLYQEIISVLIDFYPTDNKFWEGLEELKNLYVPVNIMWELRRKKC